MMRLDIRITEDDVAADLDLGKIRDGVKQITALAGDSALRDLRDDHPAVEAYDALVKEVWDDEELHAQVRDAILAAFGKRLPFEWAEGAWEPER